MANGFKRTNGGYTIASNFSFDNMKKAGRDGTRLSLLRLAIAIEGQAVLLAPVKEGRLKDSITYSIGGKRSNTRENASGEDGVKVETSPDRAVIGTNVDYAIFQEYGTARQGYAQPFLRPAFDLVTGQRTRDEVKKSLNEEYAKKGVKSK